ncbi:ROK family transcriptional regulator [Cognatishimia activa]|uniref:ROK family transcriptional regulator n=1 Tax=Cognatishimia activa TaxID=1715691 RepID=UPI0022327029|nr:ROK family transcriptional regulator [Cognatishimia activa]UZD91373.1 ROK family transcriptional regulator [Cognatishimia activa]
MQKLKHVEEQRGAGRAQILETIRKAGNIARIDIAKETLVSPATVTAITSELMDAGLIEEITPEGPRQKAKRGRPRVALKIRGDAYPVAGIKVARESVSVLIVDFEGNELVAWDSDLKDPMMSPDVLAQEIYEAVKGACDAIDMHPSELSAVGVGLAGLIDAPRSFVHWSPSLNSRNVDIGAAFSQKFECPVLVENDANLVAKAEQLFGLGRNVSNFVVITIEHGVGMGIVIDDKIYRGSRGCGAEFGHAKVQLEGALCQCGQRGCLEAYIGDYALLREANAVNIGHPIADLPSLWELAQTGNPPAQSIFDRAGRMFAMGLANVVNIFDPEVIILAGHRAAFDHLNLVGIMEELKGHVVKVDAPLTEIKAHQWGDKMWAKGAAAYALDGFSALKIREMSISAA